MLGLFTVPPEAKIKGRDERQLENQLLSAHKDFFLGKPSSEDVQMKDASADIFVDRKEAKKQRDLQRQAIRRERHLQMMDNTKKMYIDQILQRNAMCDNSELYNDLIQSEIYGDSFQSAEWTRDEIERKRLENDAKTKKQ